jgi:hypothetical protein
MLRTLFAATAIGCAAQGGVSMEQLQTLPLPVDAVVSTENAVAVALPASASVDGYSLLVTVKPLAVGIGSFVMQACPQTTCESATDQPLATMGFFPPPVVGEERQFVVQVPAKATAAEPWNQVVFSVVPLGDGSAATTALQVTAVEIVK